MAGGGTELLRVWDDVFNSVGFAQDREKEAPVTIYAGLPEIGALIVLFRVK